MRQVLVGLSSGTGNLGAAAAYYAALTSQGLVWTTTEGNGTQPCSVAGTFRNLVVRLDAAPGAGTSRTFTLRVNGVTTALTCTVADTATTARDTTHSVAVAAGDRVTLLATLTGAPATSAAGAMRYGVDFESTATGESLYGCYPTSVSGGAAATGYASPLAGWTWLTTLAAAQEVVPLAGTITRVDVLNASAPTGSNSETCRLVLNGVRQDGTAGTVNTTVAITAGLTTAAATFSLPVAAGDTLALECIKVGTGFEATGYSLRLVAAVDGESVVAGGASLVWTNTAVRYGLGGWARTGWGTVEASFQQGSAVTAFQLSRLLVRLESAPGAGKTWNLGLRVNTASPAGAPSVTVADLATTGADPTGATVIADGDRWSVRTTPTATPASAFGRWAFVQTTATPVTERVETFVVVPL